MSRLTIEMRSEWRMRSNEKYSSNYIAAGRHSARLAHKKTQS